MSAALAGGGSGVAASATDSASCVSGAGTDCCDSTHLTRSTTAAIATSCDFTVSQPSFR